MTDLITTAKPYTQNSVYDHSQQLRQTTEQKLRIIEAVVDNYSPHARDFCRWVRAEGLDINFDTVGFYFAYLNSTTYAANSIRIKRQAVLSRVRLLFKGRSMDERVKLEMALKDLNTGETRAPKVNQAGIGTDKIVSPLEYEKLLDGARSERQRCFMQFLWVTGCRVSEMLNITYRDLDHQGERVHIRILGKGKKERFIWLPLVLYRRIMATFGGSTYLFETGRGRRYSRCYVSNQISKLGRHVLGRRISAHTFRHSFATRKIRETSKIQAVSVYLGHSSVAITLSLYCHESLTEEDLSSESDLIGIAA